MQNAGLHEAQAGIKIDDRNINNLRYADDITLKEESEELRSLLMKIKEESASWETCTQVRKQQLEPDMKQQTSSKYGKAYVKAVYCHPDYLTYMQSTSRGSLVLRFLP